jgi:3-methyl-2-oxobutanoate hydroxymethyltransferase
MNIIELAGFKHNTNKIAVLTCYDASFATILTEQEIDIILVGDSLGTVVRGFKDTIPVTLDQMIYHTLSVVAGINNSITTRTPMVITDLPFMSYNNLDQALASSAKAMQAGCQMVKLEGGEHLAPIVAGLSVRGIPVCAHIGLMPQHYHNLGGYKIQGRDPQSATQLVNDAKSLEQAGAKLIVLECIPQVLAAEISSILTIPTIGIGSGSLVDGQVLVLYDILGLSPGKQLKFTHNFMLDTQNNCIKSAIKNYIIAVKNGTFPKPEHCFN